MKLFGGKPFGMTVDQTMREFEHHLRGQRPEVIGFIRAFINELDTRGGRDFFLLGASVDPGRSLAILVQAIEEACAQEGNALAKAIDEESNGWVKAAEMAKFLAAIGSSNYEAGDPTEFINKGTDLITHTQLGQRDGGTIISLMDELLQLLLSVWIMPEATASSWGCGVYFGTILRVAMNSVTPGNYTPLVANRSESQIVVTPRSRPRGGSRKRGLGKRTKTTKRRF